MFPEQDENEHESVRGTLERLVFVNEENGFTVARLQEPGKFGLTTIIGHITAASPGETLECTGSWVNKPGFGPEFRVHSYTITTPATVAGIEKYLGSGLIPGIGPGMAKRLVEAFGVETLDVIEYSSERLLEVPDIGEYRLGKIREAWEAQREIRRVMLFSRSTA